MGNFFKNPWTWLLILFVMLSVGTGVFLFRGESATVVENAGGGANEYSPVLSKETSDDLVKKLEGGNTTPGETESGDGASVSSDAMPLALSDAPASDQIPVNTKTPASASQKKETPASANASDGKLSVVNHLVSWGFAKASSRKIDTVVLHSTYNATGGDSFSVTKIIAIYKSYGVSPHYLIARDGTVYRLVEEQNIAYHAGDSEMPDGRKNVNNFSTGIEIIGKDDGTPSADQYASLEKLLTDIKSRNDIKHIVGHSDIAPERKTDPWGFDWSKVGRKDL